MKMMSDVVAVPVDDGSTSTTSTSTSSSTSSASSSKEFRERTLRSLKRGLGRLWRRHRGNASITEYDPSYKVAYLGNVLTGWAKGEGCVEKPVATLWRNYVGSSRPDVSMRLTVTCGGLTATTRDHGLTEYWAHRVTYCTAPTSHPRLVVWVYRHEGRRLRPELRCHAALCSTESTARRLAATLNARLQQALMEFRRDKVSRQNARLSLANAVYENPSLPRRKILLSTGGQNYRPPLERSKSAPKLSAIEEDAAAEELEQARLLEELRSLSNVSCSWPDQDDWRLARLVEALNRGNSGEFSDENGSISSGCETASTANSEERTPGLEDSGTNSDCPESTARSPRRVYFSDETMHDDEEEDDEDEDVNSRGITSLRRNSDGSPNFISCTGSPKFLRCSNKINQKIFSIHTEGDNGFNNNNNNNNINNNNNNNNNNNTQNPIFDFEDAEDFAEEDVVDSSPRGEHPRRLTEGPGQRRLKRADTFPPPIGKSNLLDDDEFSTLDALDEEADSDESGYVEAPPKALLTEEDDHSKDMIVSEGRNLTEEVSQNSDVVIISKETIDGCDNNKLQRSIINQKRITMENCNNPAGVKTTSGEKMTATINEEFTKCSVNPISETIKKLANASLKSSKSLEISTNNCLQKALSNLKTSKSFDHSLINHKADQDTVESPSLHQRKQLLAQQGVTV